MKNYVIDTMMSDLSELHQKAMNYAEEGEFLRRTGNNAESLKKFKAAFAIEKQVAEVYIDSNKPDIEPSRSIIVLSAAALAHDAGELIEMDKYASKVIEYNHDSYFVTEALSLKEN